jgi:hypothetical protein
MLISEWIFFIAISLLQVWGGEHAFYLHTSDAWPTMLDGKRTREFI